MRSNVVSEASLSTRVSQWWTSVPFATAAIVILCSAIYAVCLLVGYDSFEEVCFLPISITRHYEVYRVFTSTLFHVSILHLVFNMLALVPIGSGLERILGSIRYTHLLLLIATCNGVLHMLIVLLLAYNPVYPYPSPMNQCSIGYSGMIFAMIVMETNLSGAQHRSIFGFFNVPAKWYPWILLILFQILMPNVSLLGHLCGILSGFAYTFGLFNPLLFGSSTYSALENSSILASCVRRPRFIVGGGVQPASLPTIAAANSAGLGDVWRNFRSWIPQREVPVDERFPGRGRTLASGVTTSNTSADSGLQARLLEREGANGHTADMSRSRTTAATPDPRSTQGVFTTPVVGQNQDSDALTSLVAMGFEKEKSKVALDASNGDLTMAVQILSSEQHS